MKQPISDRALWFFGLAALACLGVSFPATVAAMQLFHGNAGGLAATLVFEVGAVGAELATLAIPQWRRRLMLLTITLLILTTGGNYALGVDHFGAAADIGATYATIRAAGAGWLLAIMSSAIFPALLFVFLTAFTARYRMVRGGYATPAGALAFWMAAHWQGLTLLRQEMAAARQTLTEFDTLLTTERRSVTALRRELAARPAPETIEVVYVATHRLTWDKLEIAVREMRQAESISQSTIRRRLTALALPMTEES